ncbi:unnamed protein product [Discula destructiva]
MAEQNFRPTHTLEWRYKNTKPLVKAFKDFKIMKKDILFRNSQHQKGDAVEVQLLNGRKLTKEEQKQLLVRAHEIYNNRNFCSESDSDDDE